MKRTTWIFLAVLSVVGGYSRASERFLVKDGQPKAEIVIAEDPPRTTRLAAQELQSHVEKISGAKVSIVSEPSGMVPVSVFVGRSSHTDKLGITDENLKYGAYRIVSGDNWLVLIGDDTDFVPIEPWPRSNNDIVSGKMQKAWNQITGEHWGYTHSQLRKHYTGATGLFGTPNEQHVDKDGNVNVWGFDERGSFNAVCGFLRSLGVRWYLPGELGEIVPSMASIPLPRASRSRSRETSVPNSRDSGYLYDQTVRPDFPLRTINFRFGVYGRDTAMWAMRLGVRQPYGRQAAHGLHHMTRNEHTLTNHPEWFALYGGKRHTQLGQRLNQLCYSNEELLQETVRFVRAQFDHFDMDVVSVMPPDGYTAICQCKLCEGKDTSDRGYRGAFSDYVWEFVNRVAKEVGKTHPDRMISNCAYGTYTQPPQNIDKLEPNVQVIIVGGRRPTSEARDEIRQLRKDWATKTDNPIIVFENYPFTGRGFYLPAYIPRVMGESINATKGTSRGEDIWLTMDFGENAIGYNHFLVYFTARMYWGGKQQDVVALFDEYCRLFYGPAENEMRAFFQYSEEHWREMEKDKAKADCALELFAYAKKKVEGDARSRTGLPTRQGSLDQNEATGRETRPTIYAQRLALIDNYLNGLRRKTKQLGQKRGPVPRLRLVGETRSEIVVDGKLDDEAWEDCPTAATGRLSELQTGRRPIYGTTFKTAWRGGNLYFAIRCEEHKGERLNIATTKNGDQAMWYGDVVEILLDTESHSYYQIVVNPSGARIDLDRGADRSAWYRWDSKAEVATHVADDFWTIEIRIPVVQDESDPLHLVIGRKPTQSLPWHVNICRQRIRENGTEYSAFSPTGTAGFHKPMKFAHFYDGRSHTFDADPTVTDYLIAQRAANDLLRERKLDEALDAYIALAAGDGVNDYQTSAALEQAAFCARSLQDYDRAARITGQIPLEAVASTARMQILLAQRKWNELIEQFGDEDLARWPFWKAGEGHYHRGRAFSVIGRGKEAEADLGKALELTTDSRARMDIWLVLGENREKNLKDDAAALEAYQQISEASRNTGSATYYRGIQCAARMLRKKGESEKALATLRKVDIAELRGYWHGSMLLALGETLKAAGRNDNALTAYQDILADDTVIPQHREAAQEAIQSMKARE